MGDNEDVRDSTPLSQDALRTSEQRFEILSKANALLLLSDDPEGTIQEIAEMVMTHLGADVFFNYVLDRGTDGLRLNACGGISKRVAKSIERLELGQAICGCVARYGERIISEDVQNNGDTRADLVRGMGVGCYVCHPLKVGEQTVGTLSFGAKSRECFAADEVEFMRVVANQVSIALERGRTERESAFQSFLLQTVSDSVIVYYSDEPEKGKLLYVNEAAWESRGYSREEMLRLNVEDLIAPAWRPKLKGRVDRVAAGEQVRAESEHVRKDGTIFPVEVWLRGLEFDGRAMVVNASRDITQRKQRTEALLQAQRQVEHDLEEKARLLEEEREARAEADRHARQLDALSAFEAVALSSLDSAKIAVRFATLAREQLGADMVNVVLADNDAGVLRVIGQAGMPEGAQPPAVPIDSDTQAAATFRGGKTVAIEDIPAPHAASAATKRGARQLGARAVVQVPLRVRDEVVGLASYIFAEPQTFSAERIAFLESVTAQIALGINNARLYEVERERARLGQCMVRINEDLSSSLDVDETLRDVLDHALEALHGANATITDRADHAWRIRATAGSTAAAFPEGSTFTDEEAPTLTQMRQTRLPRLVNDIDVAKHVNRSAAARAEVRAYASYPLIVRGEVIGAITIQFASPRDFSEAERDFLRRVAFAISLSEENSRLYRAEHDIADRLQSALLALPDEVRGIEMAHAYHSASEAARVGGDFYDLFELRDDQIGIVIGDVAGKGLDAAVLTSMVKNTIRAHANEAGKTPRQILTLTNDVVYKSTPTDSFVTVFFGMLDCRSGRLSYANAGHTTAVVVAADGGIEPLGATGSLLGAFEAIEFDEAEVHLDSDELLFLYTDGLTEARCDGELYGESRVFESLGRAAAEPPVEVVRLAIADALLYSGNRLRDDLAVLAVRRASRDGDAC